MGAAGALTLASASCGDGEEGEASNTKEHDDEIDGFVARTHINCGETIRWVE